MKLQIFTSLPKVSSNHTCLAVINLNSALKNDENCYYCNVFVKEYSHWKKVIRHINDNLSEFSISDKSDEE